MIQPKKYQALIFDFNGVLFWDDVVQRESWCLFSAKLREKPLSDEEIDLHVHGRNNKHTLEYLLGTPIRQEEADEFAEQKEVIYRQKCLELGDGFTLSPGSVELLELLLTHHVPFTIATASQKENVDFFFKNLMLDTWFDRKTVVYDDGKTPGKPAPDLYLRAAGNLRANPEACVVVEDSRSGIQAAFDAWVGYLIALNHQADQDWLIRLKGVNQFIETLWEINVKALFK